MKYFNVTFYYPGGDSIICSSVEMKSREALENWYLGKKNSWFFRSTIVSQTTANSVIIDLSAVIAIKIEELKEKRS